MAKRVFRPYEADRPLPVPTDLRQWLPADHTVYLLSDIVDQLDLSPITSVYEQGDGGGNPPYHPVLLTKLLFYAYAQGVYLHGAPPERHCVRETRSAWCWGLGIPLGLVALAAAGTAWSAILLLLYPLQVARLALRGQRSGRENWWRAAFLVLGKFPEMLGQLKFLLHRRVFGPARLIEYK